MEVVPVEAVVAAVLVGVPGSEGVQDRQMYMFRSNQIGTANGLPAPFSVQGTAGGRTARDGVGRPGSARTGRRGAGVGQPPRASWVTFTITSSTAITR
jgi:hypothetical protein